MKFSVLFALVAVASAISISKTKYDGELPAHWDKGAGGDPYMHDIVRRFGQDEGDGTFSVTKESAVKLADELWKKNPAQWPNWSDEERKEAFLTAWGSNANGGDKILADQVPSIMREVAKDRQIHLALL